MTKTLLGLFFYPLSKNCQSRISQFRYHHTGPISLVYALREAIARVAREGLENSISRHQENALRLHAGLEKLGLKLFVQDPVSLIKSHFYRLSFGTHLKTVLEMAFANVDRRLCA